MMKAVEIVVTGLKKSFFFPWGPGVISFILLLEVQIAASLLSSMES